jgi:hypothetical protein
MSRPSAYEQRIHHVPPAVNAPQPRPNPVGTVPQAPPAVAPGPVPPFTPGAALEAAIRELAGELRAQRVLLGDLREYQRLTYSGSSNAPVTRLLAGKTGDQISSTSYTVLHENKGEFVLHARVEAELIEPAYLAISVNEQQVARLWSSFYLFSTPMIALKPGDKLGAKILGAPYGNDPLGNTNLIRALACDDTELLAQTNRRWHQR